MSTEFVYEGSIKEVPLPALIAQVLDHKFSGMLHIQTSDTKLWIYFEYGFPAGVHVPKSQDFLGAVLREKGLIDDTAYNQSMMAMAQTGRMQGEILLEQGSITEEQLEQALSLQLARKLARLFSIRSGDFHFVDDEELPVPMEPIRVNPLALITNGIKNCYSEDDLKRALGALVGKSCKLSPGLAERLPLFEFAPEELKDMEVLGELRSPAEFVRTASSGTTTAMMILLTLLSCGMLDLEDAKLATPIDARAGKKPEPVSEPKPAPAPRPRKAAPKPRKPEPPKPKPQPAPAAKAKPARPSTGKVPADLLKRIDEKYQELEEADLWTILEVPQGAGTDQIKKSFLVLTKIFHPDRIAGVDDPGLSERMALISARLNEAFSTLSDPQQRQEYEQQAAADSDPGAPRTDDARLQFKKAMVFMKKKDLKQAAEALRWALELDPDNADYQAHRIWIDYLSDPKGSEEERARKTLAKMVPVFKADSSSFPTMKFLFMLFKRVDDDENYRRFLSMAYKRDPKDIDVAREMRLFNMRQKKDKGGFLGFMKKK